MFDDDSEKETFVWAHSVEFGVGIVEGESIGIFAVTLRDGTKCAVTVGRDRLVDFAGSILRGVEQLDDGIADEIEIEYHDTDDSDDRGRFGGKPS